LILENSTIDEFNAQSLVVESDLDAVGAHFTKSFEGRALHIYGDLDLTGVTSYIPLTLIDSKIDRNLRLKNGKFCKSVNADSVNVGASVHLEGSTSFGPIIFSMSKIGDVFILDVARISKLDLYAAIARELRMSTLRWRKAGVSLQCPENSANDDSLWVSWPLGKTALEEKVDCSSSSSPSFRLRNAHIEGLQDSKLSWPPCIDLDGFRYDRLVYPSSRKLEEWTDWLQRDPVFSPQPYTQLATILLGVGARDWAEAIQFAERDREREKSWERHYIGEYVWQTMLRWTAGYGIGLRTFYVLWCVLGFSVVGTIFLWLSPAARAHGPAWCFFASLHRLLPIVELRKDFRDFFDTEADHLSRIQMWYFMFHSLAGWILGFFLLAALGVLTQKG
jgi:hypothetical protein